MKCKICGQDNPTEARFCGNCGATLVVSVEPPAVTVQYATFWMRFGAAIIDIIAVSLLCMFGFLPGLLYYWLFTSLKGQTLGKMAVRIKVVNAQGDRPGWGTAALREILGRLISAVVLCLGFLWIAFDNNKQGWHDKIANTYVVKVESRR